MSEPIIERTRVAVGYKDKLTEWTYARILDLFADSDSLVHQLVLRCQQHEATIARLEADVKRWMEVAITHLPKIVRLEAELAELKEQRATLHAHVAEAIELLGADPAKRVLDSWTLREECDSARRKIARLEAELATEKRHWIEDDRDICQMEQERDELKAAHEKLRADVKAWSHEAQAFAIGHGSSSHGPDWLAVPIPHFEKLDALLEEK